TLEVPHWRFHGAGFAERPVQQRHCRQPFRILRRRRDQQSWVAAFGDPALAFLLRMLGGRFLPGGPEHSIKCRLSDAGAVARKVAQLLELGLVEIAAEGEADEGVSGVVLGRSSE